MTVFAIVFGVAAGMSFLLTPLIRRLAMRWGALDVPEPRKIHVAPVPRLGGVGVALAMATGLLATLPFAPEPLVGRSGIAVTGGFAAALAVCALGALDDIRGLKTWTKLAVEVIAASVVVWAAGAPDSVSFGLGTEAVALGAFGPILAVLWIVTLTNAVNLLDVADGVAAGTSLLSALGMAASMLVTGHSSMATSSMALAGALTGFLPHNMSSRIFLGDSGSLLLGFLLGVGSMIGLTQEGTWAGVPAVLVMALPLAEVGLTVMRRMMRSVTVVRPTGAKSGFAMQRASFGLFVPDRRHIPHRLIELGLSPRAALYSLWLAAFGFAAIAVVTLRLPSAGPTPLLVATAVLLYAAPRWLYEELRLLDRGALLPLLEMRWLHNRVTHVAYDACMVALSLTLAGTLTYASGSGGALTAVETGAFVLATLAGFRVAGLYRGSYRQASLAEAARALRAVVVGGVAGLVVLFAIFGKPMAAVTWLLSLYFLITTVVGARLTFKVLEFIYRRTTPQARRVVIVGADDTGYAALHEMLSNPTLGLQPAGFLDAEPTRAGTQFRGYPVFAFSESGMAHAVRQLVASDVVIPHGSLSANNLTLLQVWSRTSGVRSVAFGTSRNEAPRDVPHSLHQPSC